MVHVHSLARRRARYRRALAKGYVHSPYPIGSTPDVPAGADIPHHLRGHLVRQCQVVQTALSVQLVIHSVVGRCDSLGRAYQMTRSFLPTWISRGIRRLHRSLVAVRHWPMQHVSLPVSLNFAAVVHKAWQRVVQNRGGDAVLHGFFGQSAASILKLQKFARAIIFRQRIKNLVRPQLQSPRRP